MPHPIRGRTSCGSRLNALAQVACLWLRQAEPAPISRRHDAAPDSRIGFVRGQTACLAVPGVCLLRGGRSAPRPGSLCGAGSPCGPQCRRSALHPGDFLPDEKVTKESPRGGPPLGTPPRGTLRSPCGKPQPPRWGFYHKTRPICHFELSGQTGLFFSPSFTGGHTFSCQSVAR